MAESATAAHAQARMTSGLAADLARRAAGGKPIRVGLIGSGEMGTDIVTQCGHMAGITVAAIADIKIDAARRALEIAGLSREHSTTASSRGEFDKSLKAGTVAITED